MENGVCYLPSCRFLSEMRTGVAAPREPAGHIRTTEALERISSARIREQVASTLKRCPLLLWPLLESEGCREAQKCLVEYPTLALGVRRATLKKDTGAIVSPSGPHSRHCPAFPALFFH